MAASLLSSDEPSAVWYRRPPVPGGHTGPPLHLSNRTPCRGAPMCTPPCGQVKRRRTSLIISSVDRRPSEVYHVPSYQSGGKGVAGYKEGWHGKRQQDHGAE